MIQQLLQFTDSPFLVFRGHGANSAQCTISIEDLAGFSEGKLHRETKPTAIDSNISRHVNAYDMI